MSDSEKLELEVTVSAIKRRYTTETTEDAIEEVVQDILAYLESSVEGAFRTVESNGDDIILTIDISGERPKYNRIGDIPRWSESLHEVKVQMRDEKVPEERIPSVVAGVVSLHTAVHLYGLIDALMAPE